MRHSTALARSRAELGYDEGRLALRQGDLPKAERRLGEYIATRDTTERLQRHLARAQLAEVYARRGDVARAERELTAAGDELDQWRASLADRELRVLAFQASAGDHLSRDASVARVLGALVDADRVEPAFELAERRRARELVDRLTQAEALRVDSAPASGARTGAWLRPRSITAADARAALPDGRTALIEYVTGVDGAPTTAFVVTRSGIDAKVFVADGPLHRLPFDALRLADGRYVVERYAVGLIPSATALATLRTRTPSAGSERPGPTRLLALGDPAFPDEAGAQSRLDRVGVVYRDAFDQSGGLPRLVAAGEEVRDVARYAHEPVVRVRAEASEAFLKHQALEAFGVLHFATHALVDEATLARTALALAPGEGEDGFLSPADLAALRLNADLVVLSACRTAGGVIVAGEGLQGLTAPLLEAGARSVVATQWRIGDRSTVRLVDDFYDAMAGGKPVPDALRAAKLAAIRRGAPARDWAAFTVVGDPSVRVPLQRPSPWRAAWLPGTIGLVLLLSAGFVCWRRRVRPEGAG